MWRPGDDILRLLKILILVHECLSHNVFSFEDTIKLLGSLTKKAEEGFKRKPNKFQEHLFLQGIQPYALFLQKKLQTENELELDKESLLYQDLNLLKRGVSFA